MKPTRSAGRLAPLTTSLADIIRYVVWTRRALVESWTLLGTGNHCLREKLP